MGITYPEYPATVGDIHELRGKINDPEVDVRIQSGDEPKWFKLLEAGAIHRTSKFGTSFEGRRDPDSSAGYFELFTYVEMPRAGTVVDQRVLMVGCLMVKGLR